MIPHRPTRHDPPVNHSREWGVILVRLGESGTPSLTHALIRPFAWAYYLFAPCKRV